MRIRKISQSAAIPGKIVNSPSDSTTETYSCDYINDVSVVVSPTEPTDANRKKIWMQKGKNLFDKSKISKSFRLGTDGNVAADIECFISDYIEVMPNTTYTINMDEITYQKRIAEFREDKTAISLITTTTFTTGSETKYIRFTNLLDTEDTFQVEQNQTATSYEEYVEPKIYVKNDNGVYEEFMKKNEDEIYSTEEIKIGTWIDGKPLYRKVIKVAVSSTTQSISLNFSIDKLKSLNGGLDNGNQIIPSGYKDGNNYCSAFIQKNNNSLYCISSWSSGTFYIILEYTKTTD